MGTREELEAALAQAEAELAKAVVSRAEATAGVIDADASIEKVRAHCRQARAALAGSNCERSTQFSEPLIAGAEKPSREQSGARRAIRGLISGFSVRELDAPGWRLLARQSLMLLSLVLAYLQYYFLDIQLQVVRLPSITVLLLS